VDPCGGLIWPSADLCFSHRVEYLQDRPFRTVLAEFGLLLSFYDGEGIHDVVDVVAVDAVKLEKGRIELCPQSVPQLNRGFQTVKLLCTRNYPVGVRGESLRMHQG